MEIPQNYAFKKLPKCRGIRGILPLETLDTRFIKILKHVRQNFYHLNSFNLHPLHRISNAYQVSLNYLIYKIFFYRKYVFVIHTKIIIKFNHSVN